MLPQYCAIGLQIASVVIVLAPVLRLQDACAYVLAALGYGLPSLS